MDFDFTFKNELIKKYFEGDDSYVPSSELMYLHIHPLVTPNFLTELEQLNLDAGKVLVRNGSPKHIVIQYENLAIKMGKELKDGNITSESAPKILHTMRELYKLSKDLIAKLN